MSSEHARRRKNSRGFTLVELLVAVAIGAFIVATTFVFMVHQNRLLEFTKTEIDRDRGGRASLDLLVQDLRHAGVGVGYAADGSFNGLMLGNFTVPGGAQFKANDRAITLTGSTNGVATSINFITDDIGIRLANGSYRSITQYNAGFAQVCAGGDFQTNDVVVLSSEDTFNARTVRVLGVTKGVTCGGGGCSSGCDSFTWAADDTYTLGLNSANADYSGGELSGGFTNVVWFAANGHLRRAEVTAAMPCNSANASCGQVVAFNVESVQLSISQWDPALGTWEDRTAAQTIVDRRRIRVDVEMIVRSRTPKITSQETVDLELAPGRCLPACGQRDDVARRALRTSIEIRNSGRMRMGVAS